MTELDVLSDTVYRRKATEVLQRSDLPVSTTQIKGLRQIAQHQPSQVQSFAQHQKTRADKKEKGDESAFWQLVIDLCNDNATQSDWSLHKEAESDMPAHLKNIPDRADCKTLEERTQRNRRVSERRAWLEKWNADHIPAFFQRFCTHYLYLQARNQRHRSHA